ncbi:glutaredoxin [Encephalitozoon hellem ATCC 50504]|uniref:Glutaredoxin-2 n=1 Tax=Encephalitozoon hellem TaxID=27973 RepID=A0A9Q9C455_ENCHE|nr:glutaredoxin [Encephalitozoon hellem ATCC 50504]AFM98836.1 glutaredoxin [Encephalitozoon hellem ATCC 50504]UTX43814.1 glutaredoxin-2 [Encephalitozoon hellem]WEL39293.1 glutaredoxin-2 [Encephalitozoon hellem]|eukprot:XP_003887817.1 glutaredoxin [Encephalitozoon hellem ATCC 50504]
MRSVLLVISAIYGFRTIGGSIKEGSVDYEKMVSQEKCVLFVRRFCPYSIAARELLDDSGVRCKVVEVDELPEAIDFVKRYQRTFPAFFLDGVLVKGGYEGLSYLSSRSLPPFDKSSPSIDRKGISPRLKG